MIQIIIFFIVFGLLLLDQITKFLAECNLIENPLVLINQVFELHYTKNTGCAWSLLSNNTTILIVFTSIILLFLALILFSGKIKNKLFLFSLILIFSGGIGNLIDRVFRGYVIDFFYISCINFPIFNVADCYVCIGAILLLLYIIFFYDDKENIPFWRMKNGNKKVNSESGEDK